MPLFEELSERGDGLCELCGSAKQLGVYAVPPAEEAVLDRSVLVCATCKMQIEQPELADPKHWYCLKESMWSEVDAVKVVSYRMMHALKSEPWSAELLDMLYLDEETSGLGKKNYQGSESKSVGQP